MSTREIEILLDKYFEGETSLVEENILKEFFSSENIPGHLQEYVGMFGYLDVEKHETLAPEIEEKILNAITSPKVVPFYQNRRFLYYFTGIAASVLFLFTFLYESEISSNFGFGKQYTQQEKQLAYLQVKQTLGYVSGKMNDGIQPLQEMSKINAGAVPLLELGKLERRLMQVSNNMGKMDRSVENMKKISKFSIIVKP